MRRPVGAAALIALGLVLGTPTPAAAAEDGCTGSACGVPSCWEPVVRTRPDMERAVTVRCTGAVGARLVTPPEHGDVTGVSTDWYGLHFVAHPDADAPRFDEAVFEIDGHEGTIEQHVKIEVVPTSENSAPVCDGDSATERTDGTGPAYVYLHPYCRDPDGDDFVIEGGPPGEHTFSPKHVPAGESDSNWQYRTATFSGTETTTIWATDSLGARSEDARLEVTVGPGIDRPPECMHSQESPLKMWSRPGMIRRFGIVCTDPDADLFTARLSSPPRRGLLLPLELGAPDYGYWGVERWIDVTYVPADDSLEPDPFSITATGPHGDGPAVDWAIVPRDYSSNGGGMCGYGPTDTLSGVPGVLTVSCSDDDGDPLSLEIVTQPRHGIATPAVITPGLYGWSNIAIPYLPTLGYEGYDCVKVKLSDGHGMAFDMTLDITVHPVVPPIDVEPPIDLPPVDPPPVDPPPVDPPPVEPLPVELPPVELPPVQPPPVEPSATTPGSPTAPPMTPQPDPPAAPDLPGAAQAPSAPPAPVAPLLPPTATVTASRPRQVRHAVERALGTTAVKRLSSTRGTQVWARSTMSRHDLVRWGRAPGLVVICTARCTIRSGSRLVTGRRRLHASARRTVIAATSGRPVVLSLTLARAERRALRRARKPRGKFSLSIRAAGRPVKSLRRSIRVSR